MNALPTTPDIPLADELAGVFARMSGLLLSEDTVATSLDLLGALAHETVAGSCGAGVSATVSSAIQLMVCRPSAPGGVMG